MIRLLGGTAAIACVLAACHPAAAADVTKQVTVAASPAKVWGMIGKFEDIANWLPGVASSPADHSSTVGSVRVITLKAPGNPTVTEKLTAHNNKDRSYSYAIVQVDPKVLPVTAYSSTITVAKAGSGAKVVWHGTFKPAGGADDAAAEKAVGGLYRSGLDNIKTMAGG